MQIEIDDELLDNASDARIAEIVRAQYEIYGRFKPKVGDFIKYKKTGAVWFVGIDRVCAVRVGVNKDRLGVSCNLYELDGAANNTDSSLPKSKWELVTKTTRFDCAN